MRVSEMFESIQGEGRLAGRPALFIRLSGCTRDCKFCDTKYHKEGDDIDMAVVLDRIRNYKGDIVVWTGGEPLMQRDDIYDVITLTPQKLHTVETNGDLLKRDDFKMFGYVCCSPKDEKTAIKVNALANKAGAAGGQWDLKLVVGTSTIPKKMMEYATMLMPLTTEDPTLNGKLNQKIWDLCLKYNKRFCLRQHYMVWGAKRGV